MKGNKGITLIALVITIIVLLILAGISLAMITGNNGLLSRANSTSSKTLAGEARETVGTAITAVYTSALKDNPLAKLDGGTITLVKILDEVRKTLGASITVEEDGTETIGTSVEGYTISENGTTGIIYKKGTDTNSPTVYVKLTLDENTAEVEGVYEDASYTQNKKIN